MSSDEESDSSEEVEVTSPKKRGLSSIFVCGSKEKKKRNTEAGNGSVVSPRGERSGSLVGGQPVKILGQYHSFFMNNANKIGSIDDVLTQKYGEWDSIEGDKELVYWLFPTASPRKVWKLCLNKQELAELPLNLDASVRYLSAYKLMLNFFGLKLEDVESGEVSHNAQIWTRRYEHLVLHPSKFKHITRILESLGPMGFGRFKQPLVKHWSEELKVNKVLMENPSLAKYRNRWVKLIESSDDNEESILFRKIVENDSKVLMAMDEWDLQDAQHEKSDKQKLRQWEKQHEEELREYEEKYKQKEAENAEKVGRLNYVEIVKMEEIPGSKVKGKEKMDGGKKNRKDDDTDSGSTIYVSEVEDRTDDMITSHRKIKKEEGKKGKKVTKTQGSSIGDKIGNVVKRVSSKKDLRTMGIEKSTSKKDVKEIEKTTSKKDLKEVEKSTSKKDLKESAIESGSKKPEKSSSKKDLKGSVIEQK